MSLKAFACTLISLVFLSSCDSEEDIVDLIKDSEGRYGLIVNYIDPETGDLIATIDGGLMDVNKINGKPVLTLNPGRADIIESTDFAISADGYYFDLETISNLWFDTINYVYLNGEDFPEYNDEAYHGFYDVTSQSITFGFSVEYEDEEFSFLNSSGNMVATFVE